MEISLLSPFDAHLHLRDGELLATTVPASSETFAGAMVMPNLKPSVTTPQMAAGYKERILAHAHSGFEPYMTLFLTPQTTPELIEAAAGSILAMKLYPSGVTTHSEGGITAWDDPKLDAVLRKMAELGIPLSIHGETEGFVLDREAEFAPLYAQLAERHPDLKIMMEHISTKALSILLDTYENLYATITLHHLLFTLDDLLGGMLNPHLFCKPILKRPEDRDALRSLAFGGHPKVMFGSDSAPHPLSSKECGKGAAGIFTAPLALAKLTELFAEHNALAQLQSFVSTNAQRIYGLSLPEKRVILRNEPWTVPAQYGAVVPMLAKESLGWKVAGVE